MCQTQRMRKNFLYQSEWVAFWNRTLELFTCWMHCWWMPCPFFFFFNSLPQLCISSLMIVGLATNSCPHPHRSRLHHWCKVTSENPCKHPSSSSLLLLASSTDWNAYILQYYLRTMKLCFRSLNVFFKQFQVPISFPLIKVVWSSTRLLV